MLVLAAPRCEDPRDGGFVWTIPGELLYRPVVCDAGRRRRCGCEYSWAGVSSSRATTLAAVIDRPGLSLPRYLDTMAMYLIDTWAFRVEDAVGEARELADLAASFGAGAHITINTEGDFQVFDILETDHA